jgi:polysaccharide pyruvyl transferase WcaK-like protein
MLQSDLILIGGDILINDEHRRRYKGIFDSLKKPFEGKLMYLWIFLASILHIPRIAYALGIGRMGWLSNTLVRSTFPLLNKIVVRDQYSRKQLNRLGLRNTVITDPTVYMPFKKHIKLDRIVVTLKNDPRTNRFVLRTIPILLSALEKKYEILFIPMSFHKSNIYEQDLRIMIRISRSHIINVIRDPKLAAEIISSSKLVIGMRLHSIIFAALSDTPSICIPYSIKHRYVLDELGLRTRFFKPGENLVEVARKLLS